MAKIRVNRVIYLLAGHEIVFILVIFVFCFIVNVI